MKHTPGPWVVETAGDEFRVATSERSFDGSTVGYRIATIVDTALWVYPEHRANARLVAAAPELLGALEALEAACATIGKHHCPLEIDHPKRVAARAAIAKAQGEL